jgi:hypothetical protein
MLKAKLLPELTADIVATLAGLNRNYFSENKLSIS